MCEGFSQCDGVEDGDALPGTERDVSDPAAVGAAHGALRPIMHGERRAEIFFVAGRVRDVEEGIDGVSAAAVDECAGCARQAAIEHGIGHADDLAGDEAVAPSV
jgi:hypothetical protein